MPRPLSSATGGRTSSTLRPQWTTKPSASRLPGDLAHRLLGGLLVRRAAPVERGDRVLVLAAHAQALALGGVSARAAKSRTRAAQAAELGVDLGARRARAQQLAAVVADVGDRPDRDDLARGRGAAPADAADDPVALGDLDQQRARRLGDVGVVGVADDRRERAVDVEQDRRRAGSERIGSSASTSVAAGDTRSSMARMVA